MVGERSRRGLLAWLGRALGALTAAYVAFLTVVSQRDHRPAREGEKGEKKGGCRKSD